MGRPRKGQVVGPYTDGHFGVRHTLDDGSRPIVHLPLGLTRAQAEMRARNQAALLPGRSKEGKPDGLDGGEPLGAWLERWCVAREGAGLTSADDSRGHWKKWIEPRFTDATITSVTRAQIEAWVEWIDGEVRAGKLNWKSALNCWATLTKMFCDARRSKVKALRAREDNPCTDVEGPDRGTKRSKAYLYPVEHAALVACEDVPLRWRRLFAVASYTYTRAAELEALEWEDVDLDHGVIHIHRAIDRSNGAVKETKTNNPRRIPIEPNLLPLLIVMKREAATARVIDMPRAPRLPGRLRKYLGWAGVSRPELFITDATRKQIGFHDAGRATGITWMAIRGDDPIKIQRRAGHEDFATTGIYIREAENLETDVGQPFPPLPASLLVSADQKAEDPKRWGHLGGTIGHFQATQRGPSPPAPSP
jgi:integrase